LKRHGRDRWLDIYIFEAIDEVQQIATEWQWTCNKERPNMGIGGVAPAMKLKMAAQVLWSRSVKTGRITPLGRPKLAENENLELVDRDDDILLSKDRGLPLGPAGKLARFSRFRPEAALRSDVRLLEENTVSLTFRCPE
jgi:hypothetical protein